MVSKDAASCGLKATERGIQAEPACRFARFPDCRRSLRRPSHPAFLAPALRRDPCRDERRRKRQHDRHGGVGARHRAPVGAHRPATRCRGESCSAAIPTFLLAHAPDLWTFAALRIMQGTCMATAFALSLANPGRSLDVAGRGGERSSPPMSPAMWRRTSWAGHVIRPRRHVRAACHLLRLCGAQPRRGSACSAAHPQCRPACGSRAIASGDMSSLPHSCATAGCWLRSRSGSVSCSPSSGVFTFVNFVLARPPLQHRPDVARARLSRFRALDRHDALRRAHRGGCWRTPGSSSGRSWWRASNTLLAMADLASRARRSDSRGGGTFAAQAATTGFVSRAAPQNRVAASGCISPVTSAEVWSEPAPSSAESSMVRAGLPASPASLRRWPARPCWRPCSGTATDPAVLAAMIICRRTCLVRQVGN